MTFMCTIVTEKDGEDCVRTFFGEVIEGPSSEHIYTEKEYLKQLSKSWSRFQFLETGAYA